MPALEQYLKLPNVHLGIDPEFSMKGGQKPGSVIGFFDAGDIKDVHSYPAPACPTSTTQALACGEYGGIGYAIKNHTWSKGWGYLMIQNQGEYDSLYNQFSNDLRVFKTMNGLSAAVYTQITDVETELNGLMTYDRAIVKGKLASIRQSNQDVIQKKLFLHNVLATSEKEGRQWKYTIEKPDNGNWYSKKFDDSGWKTGEAFLLFFLRRI